MRKVIIESNVGYRYVTGTSWPIVDQLVRDTIPGRKPTYEVVRGLCNGVPDSCLVFRRYGLQI